MSMTPADSTSGAAGVSRPQALGTELDRMRLAAAERARKQQAHQQAEQAAGVGRTPVNPHVADRDADGRQGWVMPDPHADEPTAAEPHHNDPTPAHGTSGMPCDGEAAEAESPSDSDDTPGTRLDVRG
jgi:hypothetical protein